MSKKWIEKNVSLGYCSCSEYCSKILLWVVHKISKKNEISRLSIKQIKISPKVHFLSISPIRILFKSFYTSYRCPIDDCYDVPVSCVLRWYFKFSVKTVNWSSLESNVLVIDAMYSVVVGISSGFCCTVPSKTYGVWSCLFYVTYSYWNHILRTVYLYVAKYC